MKKKRGGVMNEDANCIQKLQSNTCASLSTQLPWLNYLLSKTRSEFLNAVWFSPQSPKDTKGNILNTYTRHNPYNTTSQR